MLMKLKSGFLLLLLGALATFGIASDSAAQTARRLVTQAIDERQMVELAGNIRSEANAQNDRGPVADTLVLDHMQLLLQRPAETEAALTHFIDLLQDPASPYFHNWLTAEQFGAAFGPAASDVQAVSAWLAGHGFTVNGVQTSGMVIDFPAPPARSGRRFRPRSISSIWAASLISRI
jgi:hypothetical protein